MLPLLASGRFDLPILLRPAPPLNPAPPDQAGSFCDLPEPPVQSRGSMKVVHVITRLILGGAQENTLLTCEGLQRRGHEVVLITGPALGPEGQLFDRARRGGYRVLELNCLRRAINPVHDLPGYLQLKRLLRELDPDIVHTHSAKGGVLGRWAAWALRQEAAQACCGAARRFKAAQVAACGRPRIIHTIHGLAFHPYQSAALNRFYIAIERAAARRTDVFLSVADAMTRQALAAGIGRPAQFVRVFSGLETRPFLEPPSPERIAQVRGELGIPADTMVIVTVARLFHLKGHEYILESARRLAGRFPQAVWLWVGDGLLRERLERQIAGAGLAERFRLTGLVPPERAAELLHAGDVLVHASLREGLARVLPQALLAGKAVVSFDVDGTREVVTHERTGLLVGPRDVEGLTEAQARLLADEELRRRLGQAGRDFCREEFDHERMLDRILQVYQQQAALLPLQGGLRS